ncbi:hypothetical protein BDV93DRAFT_566042 [Ceratobasidium sp. AG-I]|nr:hypothetical protein BDV93DRAFT_566042 [Ceratobasidium sp. AG-I]
MSCSSIPSNPDIAGLGVRLAFYGQTLFYLFNAYKFRRPRDAISSRTLQGMNCALILSAAIQNTSEQGLSLIDTILVSMMSCILHTVRSSVAGSVGVFDRVLVLINSLSTSAWGIFIWAHAKRCDSEAVVVLFGRSVNAIFDALLAFPCMRKFISGHVKRLYGIIVHESPQASDEDPFIKADVWIPYVFTSTAGLFIWCSIFATIEQTIGHNNQRGALRQWSFGQTLALTTATLGVFKSGSDWKRLWKEITVTKGFGRKSVRPNLDIENEPGQNMDGLEPAESRGDNGSAKDDVENSS